MADKMLKCSVLTPERTVLDAAASCVVLPAHDGEIGIMHDHAPLLCRLGVGIMRVTTAEGTQRVFVDNGFAEVLENRVSVLTEQALRSGEVDAAGARAALDEARRRPAPTEEAQTARRADLARAAAKLKLAGG